MSACGRLLWSAACGPASCAGKSSRVRRRTALDSARVSPSLRSYPIPPFALSRHLLYMAHERASQCLREDFVQPLWSSRTVLGRLPCAWPLFTASGPRRFAASFRFPLKGTWLVSGRATGFHNGFVVRLCAHCSLRLVIPTHIPQVHVSSAVFLFSTEKTQA